MKVKMMIVAIGLALLMVSQASAQQCGPCSAAAPCNSCDSCYAQPCDLFSGLRSLLKSRPVYGANCSPCDPVVACGPCEVAGPTVCDPGPAACDPGCALGNGCNCGLFNGRRIFADPRPQFGACVADPGVCDPAVAGPCDPGCGLAAPACGGCGLANDCCCPGPVAKFLTKSRCGAKKLFRNLFGTFDCGCGSYGPVAGPCGPACHGGCNTPAPAVCDPAVPGPCNCMSCTR